MRDKRPVGRMQMLVGRDIVGWIDNIGVCISRTFLNDQLQSRCTSPKDERHIDEATVEWRCIRVKAKAGGAQQLRTPGVRGLRERSLTDITGRRLT